MATRYTRADGTICDAAEALDGRTLKHGYGVHADCLFMDGRPSPTALFHDAKADEPKTIPEAISAALKAAAVADGKSPAEFLAQIKPDRLDQIAAQVASRLADAARVSGQFSDSLYISNAARSEAWRQVHAALRDVRKAEVSTAYLGDRAASDRAVRDAAYASAGIPAADPRVAYEAARDDAKARISDAWRQPDDGRSIRDAARLAAYAQD